MVSACWRVGVWVSVSVCVCVRASAHLPVLIKSFEILRISLRLPRSRDNLLSSLPTRGQCSSHSLCW